MNFAWLHPSSDAAVRRRAHRWMARLQGADAVQHRPAFERWRDADPRHATAFQQLERQWDTAGMLAQTQVGRRRVLPDRRTAPRLFRPVYAAALAMLIAIVGGAVWLSESANIGSIRRSELSQLASIDEIRRLNLSDGSIVTLDSDTAIRVAFHTKERRIVLLRGRARFEVAHDANRPFVVVAGTGQVVARGTIFDVSLSNGRVHVTLLRGSVDVRDRTIRRHGHSAIMRLQPGETTSFSRTEAVAQPLPMSSADVGWVSGMLSFDAERLGDAIAQANRYNATKVIVADPTVNDLRISGAYHVKDAAGFARAIAASLGLRANTVSDKSILLSRDSVENRPDEGG